MAFTAVDGGRTYDIHRDGCGDLRRKLVVGTGETIESCATDAMEFQIESEAIKADEAMDWVRVLPCCEGED